jgi:HK97 family phage major capsid protein
MHEAFQEAMRLKTAAAAILDEFEGKDMPQEKANEIDKLFDQAELKIEEGRRYQRAIEMDQPTNELPSPVGRMEEKNVQEDTELKTFRGYLSGAIPHNVAAKQLSATDESNGGYLVAPEQMYNGLIEKIDDEVFIRRYWENLLPYIHLHLYTSFLSIAPGPVLDKSSQSDIAFFVGCV